MVDPLLEKHRGKTVKEVEEQEAGEVKEVKVVALKVAEEVKQNADDAEI